METTKRTRKSRPGKPAIAVGYLRASTIDQTLDAQRDAIIAWAEREGVEVAVWCEDHGVSGSTPLDERDGFMAALAAVTVHRAGHLVVAKHDRLARDVFLDAMARHLVERSGAQVVAADGNGNGEGPGDVMLRQLLAVFAQFERAMIRTRTSAALQSRKRRGVTYSMSAPYGYRNVGKGEKLEPVPVEQTTTQRMRVLRQTGLSLRKIIDQLDHDGLPQRNGKRWQLRTLQRVLGREPCKAC